MVDGWLLGPTQLWASKLLGKNATHIAIAEVLHWCFPGTSWAIPWEKAMRTLAENGKAVIILWGYLSHHRGYDQDLMEYTLW